MGDYLMSLIKANDLTNVTGGIPTVKSQQLIPTVWINFNGTGTIAIRDSECVSSITDNGTGDYYANFSTAMANANYCITSANTNTESNNATLMPVTYATSSIRVSSRNGSGSSMDGSVLNVVVMGGQS
jgi:hypothetical protein